MRPIKSKARGLENTFYMFPVRSTTPDDCMWQIRLKSNHYVVISTTSKERTLECLFNMVQKYKTLEALTEASDSTMDYPLNAEIRAKRVEEYEESIEYKSEVEDTVKRAMEDYNKTIFSNQSVASQKRRKPQVIKKTTNDTSTKKDTTTTEPTIKAKRIKPIVVRKSI